MVAQVGFWTPVKGAHPPLSLRGKIREWADFYFYLGGRIAVIVPGTLENNHLGVRFEEGQTSCLKTALKVLSYATLVIPALAFIVKVITRSMVSLSLCHRVLPDGTEETGTFVNGALQRGVRVRGGQTFFLNPKLLLGEVEIPEDGIELNFAEVTIDGRTEVIPVQKPCPDDDFEYFNSPYTRHPGSPYEALLKMAQNTSPRFMWMSGVHYGSPVKYVLQHSKNRLLLTQGFLTYLLTPDEQGTLPIHTINQKSLLEVLELAQENRMVISLQDVDPQTGETLLSKWAGTGNVKLAQTLLTIDPSAIQQTEGRDPSFFTKAVLSGHTEEAHVLFQAMQSQQVELTLTDEWIQKALANDCHFTYEQFLQLPLELRAKIYQVANIYVHKEFLQKLRDFGMHQELLAAPQGAALFSCNMDAIDIEDTLLGLLQGLRSDGLLLTEEEFREKDRRQYYPKNNDIGRILGRNYIERSAAQLELQYVKVPRKIAVMQPKNGESSSIAFTISRNRDLELLSQDLQIYAEKVEPIARKATREEMEGLLDFVEEIGYNDFLGDNLLMGKNRAGEEGIYFIDAEYTNFSALPSYGGIGMLDRLMAPEDHEWLQQEILRRQEIFEEERVAREEALQEEWANQEPIFIKHGFASRKKPFTFAIADLTALAVPDENAVNE